jgi:mannose-6-phosphate isomerase-like protein (cupin superfamily)
MAACCGALIAWISAYLALYVRLAAGGYSAEAARHFELPPDTAGLLGVTGALVAAALAALAGNTPLPRWVGGVALGSLVGVAVVVIASLTADRLLGGPSGAQPADQPQSPYLRAGLVYGVPLAVVVGCLAGLLVSSRLRPRPGAADWAGWAGQMTGAPPGADAGGPRLTPEAGLAALAAAHKEFVTLFRHGTLEVELYRPKAVDLQKPHTRDEVYVVVSGSGTFVNGARRQPFGPGEVLFAPAGVEHRFEDFGDDFATWVFFYGPEGGEKDSPGGAAQPG